MKKQIIIPKGSSLEELETQFKNPLVVVNIKTGEVAVNRIREVWQREGCTEIRQGEEKLRRSM